MADAALSLPARAIDRAALFREVGYSPHPGQASVHESLASRRVLACGVRWGKTTAAAMDGVAAALEFGERRVGWIVAPSYELANKVFREIHRVFVEHFPHRIMIQRAHDLELHVINLSGGTCEIRGKTADNPTNLLGEGLDWLIVDEASRLKPVIWQSYLSQRLVDKQGWALLISTPRGKGWFYDMHRRGVAGSHHKKPEYESWNSPSWENPLLRRDFIEAERGRLPEVVFRQEYGAEFMEGAGQVFRNVRELAFGVFIEPMHTYDGKPDPHRSYCAGLDLARTVDYTVLVIMDDLRQVVFVDRFTRLDWSLQGKRLVAALERYGNPPCLVDSTGAGEPVYEGLLALGVNAKPYPFSNASKNALVNNLALACERRDIVLPTADLCPELVDELESFQYSVTDAGAVKTGAPTGYHDDCVIALALACWELGSRAYFSDDPMED